VFVERTCNVFKRISGTELWRFERFACCRLPFGGQVRQGFVLPPCHSALVVRDCIWLDVVHEDGGFWKIYDEAYPFDSLSVLWLAG